MSLYDYSEIGNGIWLLAGSEKLLDEGYIVIIMMQGLPEEYNYYLGWVAITRNLIKSEIPSTFWCCKSKKNITNKTVPVKLLSSIHRDT